MLRLLQRFASLKLTLTGMLLLGAGAMYNYGNPMDVSEWVLVVPLAFLAINLLAAIITNSRINRQPGLLVFHICLLGTVLLAGLGRLTHLDAHLELPLGAGFHPDRLMDVNRGPLHSGDLQQIHFVQGPYTVQYDVGLKRGLTHSYVSVPNESGQWQEKIVGDDRPLIFGKYRFYTTFNKGFTPVLTWLPEQGEPQTGTVNMPSYPLFEYKQDNLWIPPGGKEIRFWLQLETGMDLYSAWTLDGRNASGVLVVTTDGQRQEVKVGESVALPGGKLRFEALSTWMGYRVFYDPTIQWMFFVSVFGVLGLMHYFWVKMNLQPWERQDEADDEPKAAPETNMTTDNTSQSDTEDNVGSAAQAARQQA